MGKQLPKNWIETKLGEITSKPQYGWTSKAGTDGEIKYLRTTDLSKGNVNWETVPYCIEVPDDVSKYQVEKNDILISRAGSVGLSYRIEDSPEKAVFASYLIRFKPLINAKLVEYYLQSSTYWIAISDVSAGIAVQNINAPKLSGLDFPLPPLAEQNRIVAKLDTFFAQLETIKISMEKIPVLLKDFRQQVLTQAVTGKLTEEWRKGKDLKIDELIEEIEIKRNALLTKRDKKETGFNNPTRISVPKEWKIINLWDLSYVVTSGSRDWSKYYSNEGAFFVRSAEINNNKLRLDEAIKVSLPEKIEGKRSLIEKGNLLITITGANVGKCALIEEEIPESYVSQSVAIVKIVDSNISKYIHLTLLSKNSEGSQLENMSYGMGRPVLSLPQIKSIKIPFPSLDEQQEIVARVESLFIKADAIEQQYKSLKGKIDSLPQALLHKAFKGELTEQLDSDGDAKELIEQIQELKNSAIKSKKATTKKVKNYTENEGVLGMVAEGK